MKRLFLSLFLAGCVSKPSFAPVQVGMAYGVRTPPDKIELFRSQTPDKKFSEIGTIHDCCHVTDQMIQNMREEASARGGDALMSLDLDAQGGATATVIRYSN